ncbi:MAG: MFS transporter, partial [Chloroflexi bacterium]|nr:MFS transporter [Chloroflexota bacterium]
MATVGGSPPSPYTRPALLVVCVGVFLGALDQTVVVSALPSMIRDLKVPLNRLDEAAWIVDGYLLGYCASLPVIGRISDVRGRRRVLLGCLGVFLLASIAAALAPGLWWLVAARVAQAIGGGGLLPVALALATDDRDSRAHTVLLGIVGAAAEAGGVVGPLYGGVVAGWLGWRWIFWIHIPLIAVLAAATVGLLRPRPSPASGEHVDWLGATWIGTGLGALVLGLSQIASRHPALPLPPAVVALAGLALLASYAMVAGRWPGPIVDVSFFRRPGFAAASVVSLLVGVAFIVVMVDVPLLANTVLRRTPLEGGLLLMRFSALLPVGGICGGIVARWLGNRVTGATGLVAVALGLASVSQWPPTVHDSQITRDLAVAGFGFGLLIAPVVVSAIAAAGPGRAGTATALTHVLRVIGMMVGLAVLTSWGLARFEATMAPVPLPLPRAGEAVAVYQQRLSGYQAIAEAAIWTIYRDNFLVAAA